MKYIIDLIEDIREEVANQPQFKLYAMLLKEDPQHADQLRYGGEVAIERFALNNEKKEMSFGVNPSGNAMALGDLVDHLALYDMDVMMYWVRIAVNHLYPEVDVVGFGVSVEEEKYFMFIKL